MAARVIVERDTEPLLIGLSILGTGGGGHPDFGRGVMQHDLSLGRTYSVVDLDELPDDAVVISGGYMAALPLLAKLGGRGIAEGWESSFELVEAVRLMERLVHKKVDALLPPEIGAFETVSALSAGARMGVPVIDADPVGRAVPELRITSLLGSGISMVPMAFTDKAGNALVVDRAASPAFPDLVARLVMRHGGGTAGYSHHVAPVSRLRQCVVPRTITTALDIGRSVVAALVRGADPCGAFAEEAGAFHLMTGVVRSVRLEDDPAFHRAEVRVSGEGRFAGGTLTVSIRNETWVARRDGELMGVFPDLICMLDPGTGWGIMSIDLREGMRVGFFTLPCHQRLRSALRGVDVSL